MVLDNFENGNQIPCFTWLCDEVIELLYVLFNVTNMRFKGFVYKRSQIPI